MIDGELRNQTIYNTVAGVVLNARIEAAQYFSGETKRKVDDILYKAMIAAGNAAVDAATQSGVEINVKEIEIDSLPDSQIMGDRWAQLEYLLEQVQQALIKVGRLQAILDISWPWPGALKDDIQKRESAYGRRADQLVKEIKDLFEEAVK